MQALIGAIAGLVFGWGLMLSGMADPAKVQNFLDVAGHWDPSLGLVMAGAIGTGLLAFTWAKKRRVSLLGHPMQLPAASAVDSRLLTGAALFGVGWGLAGFCPAPAVMSVVTGHAPVLWFVAAMVVGMLAQHMWARWRSASA